MKIALQLFLTIIYTCAVISVSLLLITLCVIAFIKALLFLISFI